MEDLEQADVKEGPWLQWRTSHAHEDDGWDLKRCGAMLTSERRYLDFHAALQGDTCSSPEAACQCDAVSAESSLATVVQGSAAVLIYGRLQL